MFVELFQQINLWIPIIIYNIYFILIHNPFREVLSINLFHNKCTLDINFVSYNKHYLEASSVSMKNKLQTDIVIIIKRLAQLFNEFNAISIDTF